jgi:hypothetical protein
MHARVHAAIRAEPIELYVIRRVGALAVGRFL